MTVYFPFSFLRNRPPYPFTYVTIARLRAVLSVLAEMPRYLLLMSATTCRYRLLPMWWFVFPPRPLKTSLGRMSSGSTVDLGGDKEVDVFLVEGEVVVFVVMFIAVVLVLLHAAFGIDALSVEADEVEASVITIPVGCCCCCCCCFFAAVVAAEAGIGDDGLLLLLLLWLLFFLLKKDGSFPLESDDRPRVASNISGDTKPLLLLPPPSSKPARFNSSIDDVDLEPQTRKSADLIESKLPAKNDRDGLLMCLLLLLLLLLLVATADV
mmetsp:Transcript_4065/g.5984  ORF Transcript_4065/g.5984 Transcript_4065/m.5984 type:complete len:267 (+) Transcript_4065:122-922(+)